MASRSSLVVAPGTPLGAGGQRGFPKSSWCMNGGVCPEWRRARSLELRLKRFQAAFQLALRTDESWFIFTFRSVFCSRSVFIFYFCILIRCWVFSLIFMAYIFSMFLWQPDS